MGSTSLVLQHQRLLQDAGRTGYYVNSGWAEDLTELVAEIRIAVDGPRPDRYSSEPIEQYLASRGADPEGR